jgi:hypothetical protein
MNHTFDSEINHLAVFIRLCKYTVTFTLSFDYTFWTLVDARVKKDKHLEIEKKIFVPKVTFFIF